MANKRHPNARAERPGQTVRRERRLRRVQTDATAPTQDASDDRSATRVAELERVLEHYRNLFDSAPIPYVTLDPLGVVMEANLTYADFVKRPRRALVGRPLARSLCEEDRKAFYHHMRRCRRDTSARTEVQLDALGTTVPVELDSRLAPKSGDETLRFHTAIIDLRERREIEKARTASDKERQSAEQRELQAQTLNAAKDRFLAELSHELRTPLTPIVAAVASLASEENVPDNLRRTFEMMRRNLDAEVRLIDELLDVSRIGRRRPQLQLQTVDIHVAIQEVARELEPLFREKGVGFSQRLSAPDSPILADPLRFHQILWNVISNALHSTERGGSVLVATSNIGRDLRIVVRDDGVGIAEQQLEDIFQPFFREDGQRGKGLGLGLAIVKGLVEAHGGHIRAFSEGKGKGATFAIELPLPQSAPAGAAPPTGEASLAISPKRRSVLLVDDHADTREALQMFLEIKGYNVRLASDVQSALEAAREPVDVV